VRIERFDMERTQCLYENQVEHNLSESGVLPLTVEELLGDADDPTPLHRMRLKYPASMGSELLRERIGRFYGDASSDNVTVVNGGSEANYVACWSLLEKGVRAACMLPNYLQAWGLARAYGSGADPFRLVESGDGGRRRWALDVDGLKRAVSKKTRLIIVTNPNNPTGAVLTEEEMDEIVRAARRVGAWILADEIYRGAEVAGPMSPTFWGRYERTLITGGLSKAFGLPGLRIGWIVGPRSMIKRFCSRLDYLTVTPNLLSDRLAAAAMEPTRREAVLERTRNIIRRNLPVLEKWIHTHDDVFSYIPPRAGAIACMKYNLPIASESLFNRLRLERSVLITPGAHFGFGRYIRIGYGYDLDQMKRGLASIDPLLLDERTTGPRRRRADATGRSSRRAASRSVA
jgi:aspartate/methionine/tyrosine aminotransferase